MYSIIFYKLKKSKKSMSFYEVIAIILAVLLLAILLVLLWKSPFGSNMRNSIFSIFGLG